MEPHPDTQTPKPMTPLEMEAAFLNEIEKVVMRFNREFDLSVAGVVGVLRLVEFSLLHTKFNQAHKLINEEEEDNDDGEETTA